MNLSRPIAAVRCADGPTVRGIAHAVVLDSRGPDIPYSSISAALEFLEKQGESADEARPYLYSATIAEYIGGDFDYLQ